MTTPQDLKEVFKHGLDLLSEGRIEEWIDGFTEDGVLEFPYPAWGVPSRMQGREALLAQMTMFRDQLKVVFSEPEFSSVNEDDLVIAAYTGECTLLATGGQYCQTYLSVVRFEQNRMALYRDFWDPWLLMQAAGGELAWKQILPTLASKPTAGKQASRTPQDTLTSRQRATR